MVLKWNASDFRQSAICAKAGFVHKAVFVELHTPFKAKRLNVDFQLAHPGFLRTSPILRAGFPATIA